MGERRPGSLTVDAFTRLLGALRDRDAQFLLIGVWGANLYAINAGTVFTTQDRDLFLPLDPDNSLNAWRACEDADLGLWCGDEPLDTPRDLLLARAVIERRAAVSATDGQTLRVDLTYVMAGFDFDTVWNERREFVVEGVTIPVARLRHIVQSKTLLGRDKDRLFLATHADALEQLFPNDD